MTIEELKALAYADDGGSRSGVAEDLFLTLAPEILALVEAATYHDWVGLEPDGRGFSSVDMRIRAAIEAFNAKLEAL